MKLSPGGKMIMHTIAMVKRGEILHAHMLTPCQCLQQGVIELKDGKDRLNPKEVK